MILLAIACVWAAADIVALVLFNALLLRNARHFPEPKLP